MNIKRKIMMILFLVVQVIALGTEANLTDIFFVDAKLSNDIYSNFSNAIKEDEEAQIWLNKHMIDFSSKEYEILERVFPYKNNREVYKEREIFYNIGKIYYYGEADLKIDKKKSFEWFRLSSEKGSVLGAIDAGEMAREGNGIEKNEELAFKLYNKALENERIKESYEKIAYCYENGIGVKEDNEKATENYFNSALCGSFIGLGKLSEQTDITTSQVIKFLKVAKSLWNDKDYFAIVYGGLNENKPSNEKEETNKKLSKYWDENTDEVAVKIKNDLTYSNEFSKGIIDSLSKVFYSYSYEEFSSKYGLNPNRNYKDGLKLKFKEAIYEEENYYIFEIKKYLEYEDCFYYEFDFDGDGEDEVGIPINSGAGGAFGKDGFIILKKDKEGFYDEYSYGPDCTFRDTMNIINFDGKIYFITNPYDDTGIQSSNIIVYYVDKTSNAHSMKISSKNYEIKEIMSKTYIKSFEKYMKDIKKETLEAILSTKENKIYKSNQYEKINMKEDVSSLYLENYIDTYFKADIDNNGIEEYIRGISMVFQSKYYNKYNIFEIYPNKNDVLKNSKTLESLIPNYDFYGFHSSGNIYDYFPIKGNIVQFWIRNIEGKEYCMVLTQKKMLYSMQVYLLEKEKVISISDTLFFDEPQKIDVEKEEIY